jgi:hypothetical protein
MNEPRLIAVDWSGRNDAEQRQAIWLAEVIAGELVRLEGGRTRTELIELLIAEADRDPNLIVGFDFAFSLPAWYLQDRQLTPHQLWALLADEALTPAMRRHGLARWMNSPELPFWTTSESHARLRPEQMFRRTENDMRLPGVQPKSVFQLVGAGQVGRGSLYGMQALHRLAGVGFRIWPFDPPGLPLVVEIFPRILTGPVRKNNPSERERYVEAVPIPPDLRRLAAASEDAFDAAVSAVVMAGGVGELRALPEALGYEVEGMIWRPHHRVVLGIGGRHKGKADPVPVWLVVGSGGRCDRLRDPLDHDRHEAGVAAGWLDELLSERGRTLARELGRRRRNAGLLMRDWPRRGLSLLSFATETVETAGLEGRSGRSWAYAQTHLDHWGAGRSAGFDRDRRAGGFPRPGRPGGPDRVPARQSGAGRGACRGCRGAGQHRRGR